MSSRDRIKQEMRRLKAADELAAAALTTYGAVRATELGQGRLVLNSLPRLEAALAAWAIIEEVTEMSDEAEPASEQGKKP